MGRASQPPSGTKTSCCVLGGGQPGASCSPLSRHVGHAGSVGLGGGRRWASPQRQASSRRPGWRPSLRSQSGGGAMLGEPSELPVSLASRRGPVQRPGGSRMGVSSVAGRGKSRTQHRQQGVGGVGWVGACGEVSDPPAAGRPGLAWKQAGWLESSESHGGGGSSLQVSPRDLGTRHPTAVSLA